MTVVKPGDFIEVKCPDLSKPLVEVGQKLPKKIEMPAVPAKTTDANGQRVLGAPTAPDASESFVVLRVEGANVFLGPLRPGQFEFDVPCSNDQRAHLQVQLTPLKNEEMPKAEPPLGFLLFAYPLWIWIALAAIVLAMLGFTYGLRRWWLKRKQLQQLQKPDADLPVKNPVNEFKNLVLKSSKMEKNAPLPPPEVERFFSEASGAVRGYLEARLHFKAHWATTTEFLGQLKTATMSYSGLKDLQFITEAFLSQADLVRFSKTIPANDARIKGIGNLKEILRLVEAATAKPEGRA